MEAPLEEVGKVCKTDLDKEGDSIVRNILIAYEIDENREVLRYAKALLDTGCPENLISRRVAVMLGFRCENECARDINLVSVTGERYLSRGVLRGRWTFWNNMSAIDNNHNGNALKYMSAVFHVSSNENDQFDVIIGFNTIKEHKLLRPGEKLLAGFRRSQKTTSQTVDKKEQAEANTKREANSKAKDAHQQQKGKEASNQESTSKQ